MQGARRGTSGALPTWVPYLEQTLKALLVVQSLGSGGATAVTSCMGAWRSGLRRAGAGLRAQALQAAEQGLTLRWLCGIL